MRSFSLPSTAGPGLRRDGIAILLALAVGIAGLVFVFSQPDPFERLAPLTPLLTPEDWPNTYAIISLGIITDGPWQENRGFYTDLEHTSNTYPGGISQTAIWYADPREAAARWEELGHTFYNDEPFLSSSGGSGSPASSLYCGKNGTNLPEGFRQCWYLAYWGHWYTEVNFRSTLEEDIHLLEMQKLTDLVDRRLMSAPEEPCYGIVCTGMIEK